jgi:uncharacterized protein (DUF302 family)
MEETAYGMRIRTTWAHEEAFSRTVAALKEAGFGVMCKIDVRATMKEKLGLDHPPYTILGACNPKLAHQALSREEEVGLLLPCNVIIYEAGAGSVVSVLDPDKMMGLAANPELAEVAAEARRRLKDMLGSLEVAA